MDVSPSGNFGAPLAQTGEIIEELSPPTPKTRRFTYKLQSKATYLRAGVASGTVEVRDHAETVPVFYDPVTMIYDPLYIGPFYDGCGVAGIGSAPLGSTSPGRWVSYGNAGRKFPGTSYDFEFRAATETQPKQVRATWYTFDNLHRPIWLQTEWMTDTGAQLYAQGMSFQGELRRYRWNPKANLRSGGKRVGYIVGQLLKPGEFGVRIKVRRIWLEPGVTDQMPNVFPDGKLDDSECLQKSNYSAISKTANINDAYSGVWSLTTQEHNAETDSAIFDGKFEYHMWRLWDQSGAPIWLHAAGGSHLQTVFPDNLTLPVGYVRSPFINGLPQIDAATDEPACGPANCNLCQVSVGTMTRWHNIARPDIAVPLSFILARYKLNLHAPSDLPAPAECAVHNYFGGAGMANPAISWERPRAISLQDIDIVDGYSRFDAPPGITASVVASPLESIKTSVSESSQFEIAWAFNNAITRRLMRRKQVGSAILVLDNLAQVGKFSDQIFDRATTPITVPFEAGRYEYFVENLNPVTGVYYVESDNARAAPVYVVNPAPPPQPPQCLNIVPAPSAGAPVANSCAISNPYPDVSVAPNTPMLATFPNVSAYEYRIREEIVLDGRPQQTGCNSNSPGVYYTPGILQQIPFNACATPGEYLYRIVACSLDGGCGAAYPTEGIRVLVGNAQTLPAPTNVTAIAEGPALGYRVSWTAPTSAQTLTYTIARRALSSPPAASPSPAPPGTGPADQSSTSTTITGTETNNGTYYFWVKACAGALCSQWSQPSSGLVLPVVASVVLPPKLTPAASAPPTAAEIAASSKVGSLDGSLRVGESGAVNFSIGFVTAPGKGGLVPEMGLAYSGDTSLGVAGIGFNLTGLSAVSRCRKTIEAGDGPGPHPQVNFDADASNDAFCLDGQRLFQVATGTQIIDGTSYPYTEFRTEIETFQRVRAYASTAAATGEQLVYGPLFWRVEAKDGSIRDYGRGYSDLVTNAAVYANDGQLLFLVDPATGLKIPRRLLTDMRQHVATWALSATGDRLGSRVRYRYDTGYTGTDADPFVTHFLSRVFYTGFNNGSVVQQEHAALAFDYTLTSNSKARRGWSAGSYSEMNRRLIKVRSCLRANSAVAITTQELDATNAAGLCGSAATTLRIYSLQYSVQADTAEVTLPGQWSAGRYGSGRERLTSVQTCADVAGATCWPATTLNWTESKAGFDFYTTNMGAAQFQRASGIRFSDVTGDGKPDAIWREELTDNQPDKIRMNRVYTDSTTGNGVVFGTTIDITKVPDTLDNNLYGNDPDRNWGLLDVNGDSLDDLINTESVANNGGNNFGPWGWFVRYATGTDAGFSTQRTQLAGTSAFNGAAIVAQFQFTDTDGDGTVDMLSPKEVSGGAVLQIAKGVRQTDGSLVFANPVDVQLDFGAGGSSCYRVGFGRKHQADRWDSYDFNGDALADLTLRVQNTCTAAVGGENIKPVAPPTGGYQFGLNAETALRINTALPNGPENPAANLVAWGVFVAQNLSTFKLTYQPSGVADAEGAFRPTDINGDGLMDLVKQEGQYGEWSYQLNTGNGAFGTQYCLLLNERWISFDNGFPQFSNRSCFATKLPNTQSNLISDGQILLQDFDGDGFSDVWHSENDPINQQSSDGKRFRVYRWKGANGAFSCTTATAYCSDFESRIYFARNGSGEDLLTIPTGIWTNAIGGGSLTWRHLFVDLDNDGYGDSFAYKKNTNVQNAGYILIRSTDHHQPRDVLTSITSGFGATTNFSYSPLSYSTVYTRDYNANQINGWGRGSSVVDLSAPTYVVTKMATPAPLASNAANMATMHYRYQGMKAQVGGRGSLGFRKIYTLNAQNNVETTTEYAQQFPLAGRPLMTQSRALNSVGLAKWKLSCNPDDAANSSAACFYPQPQCSGGVCEHFSGSDVDPTVRGQTLARNSDESAWRMRSLSSAVYGAENATLAAGTPTIIHVYAKKSLSERFESSSTLQNIIIASSVNKFYRNNGDLGYDDYGNLKYSVIESYVGAPSATAQSTVTSESVYTNNPSTWLLGRMTSTNVTHTRPGQTAQTRMSQFDYDANGQLYMERVQPGSAEFQMTKYTQRHAYGMPSITYSCSKAVEDAGRCNLGYELGNQVIGDARLWVYRYAENAYDDVTGLPTTAYVLRGTGTPTKVSAGSTTYTKWGSPLRVTPTDGAYSETTYDAFGRPVHQYSAAGAQSTTLLGRCGVGGITCPTEAVTRAETRVAGGAKSWSYADTLARTVAGLSEQFAAGKYTLSRIEFDGLGRQIRQSEPYQTMVGPNAANNLPGASGVPYTESCYDVGGRVIYLKLPNHVGAFSCASPPTAAQLLNTQPDDINVIQTIYRGLRTETINGMGQAQSTTVNAMGETVMAEDANGFKTDFAFDALGNLSSVTRGAGTSEQTVSSMLYDIMGRRSSITDPDAGYRRSFYTPAGESIREIDAKGQCMQSTLDFNGRVVQMAEHDSSAGDSCFGVPTKVTSTTYDRDKLGSLSSTSYGVSANSSEPGAVRIDALYDNFSRPVSTRRCVSAVTLNRTDALNCKVDQQAFDQYSRGYWSSDASSENVLHQVDVYAAGGNRRGTRMFYSDATTLVDGVSITPGFAYKTTALDGVKAYYEVLESNARGQVSKERVDGKPQFVTTRGYENSTGRLLTLNTGSFQNLGVTYDELGNLRSRTDLSAGRNLLEKFDEYDVLNRVKKAELFSGKGVAVSQGVLSMSYSSDGNITSKTGTGSYG